MAPLVPVPNHKKLVNACYPKDLDPTSCAPDGNSLGKLAYYSSKRPHKLPKVSRYLISLAKKEAAAGPVPKAQGGLIVTLDIFKELIKESPSHLSFFGGQALEAVGIGLAAGGETGGGGGEADIEILCKAAGVFRAFTTYAQGTLIGTDEAITHEYHAILRRFASLARGNVGAGSRKNAAGARYVAIGALEGSVVSEAMYTSEFSAQADIIIPALMQNIAPGQGVARRLITEAQKTDKELNFHQGHSVKRPLAERRVRSIRHSLADDKPPTEEDIATAALHALRALFRLANGPQIEASLTPMIAYLDQSGFWSDEDWCSWLADTIVMWSHLQYRFVVFNFLLDRLTAYCTEDKGGRDGDAKKPRSLLAMLTAIMGGKTTLVGLGVGNVLADLVRLIETRAQLGGLRDPLMPGLVDAVGALGTHIYYTEQVGDLCRDVISHALGVQGGRASKGDDDGETLSSGARDAVLAALGHSLEGVLTCAHGGVGRIAAAVPITEEEEEGEDKKAAQNGDAKGKPKSKGQLRDAVGRPMMKVEHTSLRSYATPSTWKDALVLLSEGDYAVRVAWGRATLVFLRDEVPLAERDVARAQEGHEDVSTAAAAAAANGIPPLDGEQELSKFFNALNAAVYQTTTSRFLGSFGSRPSTRPPSTHLGRGARKSSTPSSIHSGANLGGGGGGAGESRLAQPMDYTVLKHCLVAAAAHRSAENLLATVPMLLALDRDAGTKWVATTGPAAKEDGSRRHASREVVAWAVEALGKTWDLKAVVRAGSEAARYLEPSVCPALTQRVDDLPTKFGAGRAEEQSSRSTVPVIDRISVIEALSGSNEVQKRTGLDKATLRSAFGKEWTYDEAIAISSGQTMQEKARRPSVASSNSPRTTQIIPGSVGRSRSRSFRSTTQPSFNDLHRSLGDASPKHANPDKLSPRLDLGTGGAPNGSALSRGQSQRRQIAAGDVLANLKLATEHMDSKQSHAAPPTIISPPYDL